MYNMVVIYETNTNIPLMPSILVTTVGAVLIALGLGFILIAIYKS